jgi:hypothetical protein
MNLHLRIREPTKDNLASDILCVSIIPANMSLGGYSWIRHHMLRPPINFAKPIEAFSPHIRFIALSQDSNVTTSIEVYQFIFAPHEANASAVPG